jgi:hypothetical protein
MIKNLHKTKLHVVLLAKMTSLDFIYSYSINKGLRFVVSSSSLSISLNKRKLFKYGISIRGPEPLSTIVVRVIFVYPARNCQIKYNEVFQIPIFTFKGYLLILNMSELISSKPVAVIRTAKQIKTYHMGGNVLNFLRKLYLGEAPIIIPDTLHLYIYLCKRLQRVIF